MNQSTSFPTGAGALSAGKDHNPDILTCLANLSADEVFTPPKLANAMLDTLPVELWSDPNATFLDPCTKSGVFLREIARRLNDGLAAQMPDDQKRIDHILTKQVFGMATGELTWLLARRSVYCTKKANGKYSVASPGTFTTAHGNILYPRKRHKWNNQGRCICCGANKEQYDRDKSREAYAYPFIHGADPTKEFNMKFDVIVGNPPYQLDTGGSGRQARPIYNTFVNQAKNLEPRYLTMVIPSRWFAGGMGLGDFRESMLNDDRMERIVDYPDAREVFPGVDIAGGVCYFLWNKQHRGECQVENKFKGDTFQSKRKLNEFPTFVRFAPAVSILRKVLSNTDIPFTSFVSSTRPFGLKTSDRPTNNGSVRLVSSGGDGTIPRSRISSGEELVDVWKVLTSKTSHDHAGQPDKEGMRRVFSRLELLGPQEVCTESYIVVGPWNTQDEAANCLSYMQTRFVRFLVSLLSFSQDITRDRFSYVPSQDMTVRWTDSKLAKKYGLSDDERAFVNSKIKEWE